MWGFLLLMMLVLIVLIFSAIYVVKVSHRILSRYITHKGMCWLLAFIPLLLFILGIWIDTANAIVVDMHLIVIVAVVKFIFYLLKKITQKEYNEFWTIGIGILVTTLMMGHAYYLAHHVIKTNYTVDTSKEIEQENFRIVQISDSHLGAMIDGKMFAEYMQDINELHPDLVVVTGDFVDDDTSYEDMVEGAAGLGLLQPRYGVYFVYGNHDKGYFRQRNYQEKELREELQKNHVIILEDTVVDITDKVVLVGRQDAGVREREKINDLTKEIDKDKYIILLDHQPSDYDEEAKAGIDLVLSGHTHGGQLIPIGELSVILGINDGIYGMKKQENTTFIINAGISNWAIKFKTGTVAEYVIVDIVKK